MQIVEVKLLVLNNMLQNHRKAPAKVRDIPYEPVLLAVNRAIQSLIT